MYRLDLKKKLQNISRGLNFEKAIHHLNSPVIELVNCDGVKDVNFSTYGYQFKEEIRNWILAHHAPGKRSKWFPFYTMSTGEAAIMVNIEPDDAVIFALTFKHEKMDKE